MGNSLGKTKHERDWKISYKLINVGQGDSAIVAIKHFENEQWIIKKCILIDGGDHLNGEKIRDALNEVIGNKILDAIIITHWDGDHYLGLLDWYCGKCVDLWDIEDVEKGKLTGTNRRRILIDFWIDYSKTVLICSKNLPSFDKKEITEKYCFAINSFKKRFLNCLEGVDGIFNVNFINEKVLDKKVLPFSLLNYLFNDNSFANQNKIDIQILGVDEFAVGSNIKINSDGDDTSIQNRSSVSCLINNDSTFLFTSGDLGKNATSQIKRFLYEGLGIETIQIVKINHHGSRNNTTKQTLFSFPTHETALFSFGEENRFLHPDTEILDLVIHKFHGMVLTTNYPSSFGPINCLEDNNLMRYLNTFNQINVKKPDDPQCKESWESLQQFFSNPTIDQCLQFINTPHKGSSYTTLYKFHKQCKILLQNNDEEKKKQFENRVICTKNGINIDLFSKGEYRIFSDTYVIRDLQRFYSSTMKHLWIISNEQLGILNEIIGIEMYEEFVNEKWYSHILFDIDLVRGLILSTQTLEKEKFKNFLKVYKIDNDTLERLGLDKSIL